MADRLAGASLRAGWFQCRRGTASEWTAINPVLKTGEPGYEEGTGKFKIGDGVTSWTGLPYQGVEGAGSGSGVILPWVTATEYVEGQPVTSDGQTYLATEDHTSGATFAGDLADELWSALPVESSHLVGIDLGGNLGATETIDTDGQSVHAHSAILNANCAITTTNKPADEPRTIKISGLQDGTGGWTLTVDGAAVTIPDDPGAAWEVIIDWDGTDAFVYFPGGSGIQGPPGPAGADGEDGADSTVPGPAGADGSDGVGVPAGGATDQVLAKASATDFDTEWVDAAVGGGGPSFAAFRAGRYYAPPMFGTLPTTLTVVGNRLYATPFFAGGGATFDRIHMEVTTAAATGMVRLGIYDDAAGYPGALLLDTGQMSVAATGSVQATISEALEGWVWLAFVEQVTNTLVARAIVGSAGQGLYLVPIGQADPLINNVAALSYISAPQSGALPDPFPAAQSSLTASPLVKLRAA